MARPLPLEIQWNRRTPHLDQIVNELHQERPVTLKITDIPDEHRIQASQELKRTPFWNDLHTAGYYERGAPRLVDPKRDSEKTFLYSDGAASNPVLTGLQSQGVRGRQIKPFVGAWTHFANAQEAAERLNITDGISSSPNSVLSCCEMNKSRAAQGPGTLSAEDRTYEFEYADVDRYALEIWYGICRSLALLPESETGINMIGTVVRSTTRRWKKMRADPVFYHQILPENTAEQVAAANELRKRIADQYRRGSSVIAFSEDEPPRTRPRGHGRRRPPLAPSSTLTR